MDRQTPYPNQILTDADLLNMQKNTLVGLGWLIQSVLGAGTFVDGLACTQMAPASLQVQVAAGVIYSQAATDTAAYGSLGTDAHLLMKEGLVLDPTTLTLIAPATAGQSINYLVQVAYADNDTNNVSIRRGPRH